MEDSNHDAAPDFRTLFEAAPDLYVVVDPQLSIIAATDAFVRATATPRERLIGRPVLDVLPEAQSDDLRASLARVVSGGGPEAATVARDAPDAGFWKTLNVPIADDRGTLRHVILRIEDVTDAMRREERLLHAQKLEAASRLAGGLAHDFNNLLSVIVSYAELAMAELRAEDPLRADVCEIHTAGLRAAELTRQLLAFSRRQLLVPRVVDLDETLTSMGRMLERVIGEHIELRVMRSKGTAKVKVDPAQVEQVILNLVLNARDAMPAGGRLTIETRDVVLDEAFTDAHPGAAPGPHVLLAVTDTGIGMDAATQARVFEPFFTTKDPGKGTGLGLPTVYGIVQQSGGSIALRSEPGRGTRVEIYFPRTNEASDPPRPSSVAPPQGGTETVLLVEDDKQLRGLVRGILTRHGYGVLEAQDAHEALLLCDRYSGTIDLLLADLVLPGMSGPRLAEVLAPRRARMKVLYMSGYTEDAILDQRGLGGAHAVLQKPVTPEMLTRRVREVLDGA